MNLSSRTSSPISRKNNKNILEIEAFIAMTVGLQQYQVVVGAPVAVVLGA